MKKLSIVLAFAAIATAGHAQVSKTTQDSTNQAYINLRDFIATTAKHDTAGLDALIQKQKYWRNKGIAECKTEKQRQDFFDSELHAYAVHAKALGRNPE